MREITEYIEPPIILLWYISKCLEEGNFLKASIQDIGVGWREKRRAPRVCIVISSLLFGSRARMDIKIF